MDPRDPQDLWILGPPGTSRPQEPWEITSTVWISESKHPETLKLKHKQRTFLNYVIGQSQTKAENSVYLLRLFYLSSYWQWLLKASLPLCFLPATSLLSTEMTIKDIWLDILGLKKSVNFLHYNMWKYL